MRFPPRAGIALFGILLLLLSAMPAAGAGPARLTVDGRPGLLTMAIPVGTFTHTFEYTLRYGYAEGDVNIRNRKVREGKDEIWLSGNVRLHPNVLFVATYLSTSRDTSPAIPGIQGITGVVAGGVHVEVPEKSLAFGGSYANLSDDNLLLLDISQLEHLRHAYVTVSDTIYNDIKGYLQIKQAFSQEYTALFPNGRRKSVPMKRATIGTLGAIKTLKKGATLFGEAQMFDDAEFLYYGSEHYSANIGYRMQKSRYSLEFSVRSLNRTPTWYLGLSAVR